MSDEQANVDVQFFDKRRVKRECVIVNKVFASCFQRECDPRVEVQLPAQCRFKLVKVKFEPGVIVENTLIIEPIDENDPTLNRVQLLLRINFTVIIKDVKTGAVHKVPGSIEFEKDILIRIPVEDIDEFDFRVVVETRSEVLRSVIRDNQLIMTIGSLIIIKVVGLVQLEVLSTGYCVPKPCQEFSPEDVCEEFLVDKFPPENIFPKQLDQKCR